MNALLVVIAIGVFLFLMWLLKCINVVKEWERGVVLRLGRMLPVAKGPGLVLIFFPIDIMIRVSLRVETLDVPAQDVITKDNVSAKVNAVCYFRVIDANLAISQVQNYLYATSQLAQTNLRSVIGQFQLDDVLSEREKVNEKLQTILDLDTEPWGIKVTKVEVKQVDIPDNMQRAIARQAEAERERRAKIINADGELQASAKLAEAAAALEAQPVSVQLRYLQTLQEIGTEKNTTVIFPVPIDLVSGWIKGFTK
ncbi:MAG TPA: slipin family protein [Candidatus Acidoferrales bacterium]|nr:slipin family protein [Candidatus Acidoferrales bacterium]